MPFTAFRRLFNRISTGWGLGRVAGLILGLLLAAPLAAQEALPALFRVFLTDGRVLTAHGEWARLDDRIVFSMPTRRGDFAGELHLATVPASQVDWERTERYALALRAQSYAVTRGEADFARLSDEVARTLNAIASMKDPAERLAHAETARRTLSSWPGAHFGYRAVEVREILGMLDEVIIDLRSAAGLPGTRWRSSRRRRCCPTSRCCLHPPTPRSRSSCSPPRTWPPRQPSALRCCSHCSGCSIARPACCRPRGRASSAAAPSGCSARSNGFDTAYAQLQTTTLAAATRSASRADVRGIEKLRTTVRDADARLGGKRPAEVEGLLATLDVQLESARAMQLALDQWELRSSSTALPPCRDHPAACDQPQHGRAPGRALPGRPAGAPPALDHRALATRGAPADRISPPAAMQPIHALFRSARAMAEQAFTLRLSAAAGNDHARAASLVGRGRRPDAPGTSPGRSRRRLDTPDAVHSVITPRRTRLLRVPSLRGMQDLLAGLI